jgi:hypothetical protein
MTPYAMKNASRVHITSILKHFKKKRFPLNPPLFNSKAVENTGRDS